MQEKNKVGRPSRPNTWKSGVLRTDIPNLTLEDQHKLYYAWLQQRNQANFREETWTLSFDDWLSLWRDHWQERGRRPHQYCMTRIDIEKEWSKENVEVQLRSKFQSEAAENSVNKRWRGIQRTPEQQFLYERSRRYYQTYKAKKGK